MRTYSAHALFWSDHVLRLGKRARPYSGPPSFRIQTGQICTGCKCPTVKCPI
jgi:hypothetical protein